MFARSAKVWLGWPLHPFLVSAFFVISLFASAETRLLPMHAVGSLIASQILSLLLLSSAWFIQRDKNKAAISATVILLWCMAFRPFCWLLMPYREFLDTRDWIPLLLYLIVLALSLYATSSLERLPRLNVSYPAFTVCMNVFSLALLCTALVPVIAEEISENQIRSVMVRSFQEQFDNARLDSASGKPDVYYIILDQFAADESLEQFFHYSDERFLAFLKDRGFYLPKKPISNYDNTFQSLSSSLNMSYLDPIPRALGRGNADGSINVALMQDNAVVKLFRGLGYKIVNVSASDMEDSYWPNADVNIGWTEPNDFETKLAMLTPLSIVEHYLPIFHDAYARRRLTPYTHAREISEIPGPKFVYIHEEMPHSPFLFDEDGGRLSSRYSLSNFNYSPDVYLRQLKFVEKKTMELISQIQDKSRDKPIIILQSDHGPDFQFGNPTYSGYMQWGINERLRILNAYYFPGKEKNGLYASISPVNSFRVLFDDYFQAHLPLLADRALVDQSLQSVKSYKLTDVTDKLEFTR